MTTIGKVWAVCDHFEEATKKPAIAPILKSATGVTRGQLRKWVKDGRLNEFDITLPNGQRVKGYSRPKENSLIEV